MSRFSFDQEGFLNLVDDETEYYLSVTQERKKLFPLPPIKTDGKKLKEKRESLFFRETDFFVDFCTRCHERIIIERSNRSRYNAIVSKSGLKFCDKCSHAIKDELRNEMKSKEEELKDLLEYFSSFGGEIDHDSVESTLIIPELSLRGYRLPRYSSKKKKVKKWKEDSVGEEIEKDDVIEIEFVPTDDVENSKYFVRDKNNPNTKPPKFKEEEISNQLLERERSLSNIRSHLLNEHFPSFLELVDRFFSFFSDSVCRFHNRDLESTKPFSSDFERALDFPKARYVNHVTSKHELTKLLSNLESLHFLNEMFRIWPFAYYTTINDLIFVTNELFQKSKTNETKSEKFVITSRGDFMDTYSHHSPYLWRREDGTCINIPISSSSQQQQQKDREEMFFSERQSIIFSKNNSKNNNNNIIKSNVNSVGEGKMMTLEKKVEMSCFDFNSVMINHMIREKEMRSRFEVLSSSSILPNSSTETSSKKKTKSTSSSSDSIMKTNNNHHHQIKKQDYDELVKKEELRRDRIEEEMFVSDLFNIPNAAHGHLFLCVLRILQKYLKIIGPDEKAFFLRFKNIQNERKEEEEENVKNHHHHHLQKKGNKIKKKNKKLEKKSINDESSSTIKKNITISQRKSHLVEKCRKKEKLEIIQQQQKNNIKNREEVMEVEMILNGSFSYFNLPNSKKRLDFFLTNNYTNSKKRKNYESSLRVLCFIIIGISNCLKDDRNNKSDEDEDNEIIFPYPMWMNEKNEIFIQSSPNNPASVHKIEFFRKKSLVVTSLRLLKLILTNLKYCIIQM